MDQVRNATHHKTKTRNETTKNVFLRLLISAVVTCSSETGTIINSCGLDILRSLGAVSVSECRSLDEKDLIEMDKRYLPVVVSEDVTVWLHLPVS